MRNSEVVETMEDYAEELEGRLSNVCMRAIL